MLAEVVLQKIADQLQDAGINGQAPNVQWPKDELIRYVNEARRLIVELRPNAGAVSEAVYLNPGAEQQIPPKGSRFLKAHSSLRYSDRTVLPLGPTPFRTDTIEDVQVVSLTASLAMVLYRDLGGSGAGMACLAILQEDWVRFTTPVPFNLGYSTLSAIALNQNRVLVVYDDLDNGSFGTSVVIEVDREELMAAPPQVFAAVATAYPVAALLDSGVIVVAYQDQVNGKKATVKVLQISDFRVQAGPATVLSTGEADYLAVSKLTPTKAIIGFQDAANSGQGTAQVVTVSGYTITADLTKAKIFQATSITNLIAFRLSGGNVLFAYTDGGNASKGTACVCSVSGITITAGAAVVFRASSTLAISGAALPGNRAALAYADAGSANRGTAQVLSVSGTVITTNTEQVFNTAGCLFIGACLFGTGYLFALYQDGGNSNQGYGVLMMITATALGLVAPNKWTASNTINLVLARLDAQHLIACYADSANLNYLTAVVFSIVGDVITAGTPVQVAAADASGTGGHIALTVLEPGTAIVAYRDGTDALKGKACPLAIAGTVITPGSVATFLATEVHDVAVSRLNTNTAIVAYCDHAGTDKGCVCVLQLSGVTITPGTQIAFSIGHADGIQVHGFSGTQALIAYIDTVDQNRPAAITIQIANAAVTIGTSTTVIGPSEASETLCMRGLDSQTAVLVWSDQGNQGRLTACVLYGPGPTVSAGPILQVSTNPAQNARVTVTETGLIVVAYQDQTQLTQVAGQVLKRNPITMELTAGPVQILSAGFGSTDAPVAHLTGNRIALMVRATNGPISILALPGNIGAIEVLLGDIDTFDRHQPGWRGDPPDAVTQTVLHDPMQPSTFWCWPPVPAGSQVPLYLEYSRNPDDLPQSTSAPPYSATATDLAFQERYEQPLIDWAVYRAFNKDDDVDLFGKAAKMLASFEASLGAGEKKDAEVSPNARTFPYQPMTPKPAAAST